MYLFSAILFPLRENAKVYEIVVFEESATFTFYFPFYKSNLLQKKFFNVEHARYFGTNMATRVGGEVG